MPEACKQRRNRFSNPVVDSLGATAYCLFCHSRKHSLLLCCSSGLVAAISSPDWPTRRAAAEAIKALTVALGPGLDSPGPSGLPAGAVSASLRAAEALGRCRFDKVKPVRDTVQEAQAVLLDLQVPHLFHE